MPFPPEATCKAVVTIQLNTLMPRAVDGAFGGDSSGQLQGSYEALLVMVEREKRCSDSLRQRVKELESEVLEVRTALGTCIL